MGTAARMGVVDCLLQWAQYCSHLMQAPSWPIEHRYASLPQSAALAWVCPRRRAPFSAANGADPADVPTARPTRAIDVQANCFMLDICISFSLPNECHSTGCALASVRTAAVLREHVAAASTESRCPADHQASRECSATPSACMTCSSQLGFGRPTVECCRTSRILPRKNVGLLTLRRTSNARYAAGAS